MLSYALTIRHVAGHCNGRWGGAEREEDKYLEEFKTVEMLKYIYYTFFLPQIVSRWRIFISPEAQLCWREGVEVGMEKIKERRENSLKKEIKSLILKTYLLGKKQNRGRRRGKGGAGKST